MCSVRSLGGRCWRVLVSRPGGSELVILRKLRKGRQPSPEPVDLDLEISRGATVVDDEICLRQSISARGLATHPCPGIFFGKAAIRDEPTHLLVFGYIDHDRALKAVPGILGEQGNVEDDDVSSRALGQHAPVHFFSDCGMDNGVQFLECLRIREHDVGDSLTVESPCVVEDSCSEFLGETCKDRRSRFLDLSHDGIGIDDHCPTLCQELRHRGLSGSDATSQADQDHGLTLIPLITTGASPGLRIDGFEMPWNLDESSHRFDIPREYSLAMIRLSQAPVNRPSPSVCVITSHALLGRALQALLTETGFDVVHIENAHLDEIDLLDAVRPHCRSVDVVVIGSWGMNRRGCQLTRLLVSIDPMTRVVVIDDSISDEQTEEQLRSGAIAVIGRATPLGDIAEILGHAARGDSIVSSTDGSRDRVALHDSAGARRRPHAMSLSIRETEILQLVADGFSLVEVARRLIVSHKTVKHHLSSIYAKLGVANRTDAVVKGLRLGFIDLDAVRWGRNQA